MPCSFSEGKLTGWLSSTLATPGAAQRPSLTPVSAADEGRRAHRPVPSRTAVLQRRRPAPARLLGSKAAFLDHGQHHAANPDVIQPELDALDRNGDGEGREVLALSSMAGDLAVGMRGSRRPAYLCGEGNEMRQG
jgi:hypothetical protein